MEYEQAKKKNILLYIYLASSEMKRRRTTEGEKESNVISLPVSPFLSFINNDGKKRRGKRRDSTDEQLVTNDSR